MIVLNYFDVLPGGPATGTSWAASAAIVAGFIVATQYR